MVDCLSRVKPLGSLAAQNLQQFMTPLCDFRVNFHRTQENDAFVKRCLDCVPRLQRSVDGLIAEMGQWVGQLKPDNQQLEAQIARLQQIDAYFTFSYSVFKPDLDFKRQMAPDGQLYNVREDLSTFPYLVASWLKRKKHEWIVVGMEKNHEVTLVWVNKGEDRTKAQIMGPGSAFIFVMTGIVPQPPALERLAKTALAEGCTSLLLFHNHPNPDPSRYTCTQPSQVDLEGSALRAKLLNDLGLNLLEFVTERGRPYLYRFYIAEAFLRSCASAQPRQGELNL